MKFDEAHDDLSQRITDPDAPERKKVPTDSDNASAMAMLGAMMSNSDFKGAGR